jgi:hypothetical protein
MYSSRRRLNFSLLIDAQNMYIKIIDVQLKEQKIIKLDGINLRKLEINVIGSIIVKKEENA